MNVCLSSKTENNIWLKPKIIIIRGLRATEKYSLQRNYFCPFPPLMIPTPSVEGDAYVM